MAHNIWFTSDHHWSHRNILNFTDKNGNKIRNFSSVEEMDEYMIEKWNECIKPGDKVYHLGDITFNDKKFGDIINRLNGSKRLLVGNHDNVKFLSSGGWFKNVGLWRRFDEHGFVASHVPLHHEQFYNHRKQFQMTNVHGHTHQNSLDSPLYINVCVEVTGYKPVHLDEIIEKVKETK